MLAARSLGCRKSKQGLTKVSQTANSFEMNRINEK